MKKTLLLLTLILIVSSCEKTSLFLKMKYLGWMNRYRRHPAE